jgi:preprotein translocase subunit SecG
MLYYFVTALYILVCFTMMLVVYLQQGKGGDIASAFGGGGSSQSAFGARSGATVLSRATTICAILFMVGALALGIIGRRGPGSVIGGRAPLTQPSTPATTTPARTPAAPAPATPAAPAPAAPK